MAGLVYVYLVTYLGAAVALFYPLVGLFIYIHYAIIKPESLWHWSVGAAGPGRYSFVVAVAMLIGWAIQGGGKWNLGRGTAIAALLVGFLAWVSLGLVYCEHVELAQHYVTSLAKIVLPFLVGITLIDSKAKLRQLAWVIVLSQGYLAFDFNQSYYNGFNRVVLDTFGGFDNNCMAAAMVAGTVLAFFLGMAEKRLLAKIVAFGSAVLMAHVIMFSFSRGGQLGLIAAGIAGFMLIPKTPRYYLLFFLAAALAYRMAGPEVRQRFMTIFVDEEERDQSANSRIEQWKACLKTIRDNPFLGVGANHWPLQSEKMGLPRMQAHSLWFQTGAEAGIPGLLLLSAFYGLTMWRLLPFCRRDGPLGDPWLEHMSRGVIAALTGFAVSVSFISVTWLELPYYVAMLGAAILRVTSDRQAMAEAAMDDDLAADEEAFLDIDDPEGIDDDTPLDDFGYAT
ncbi:hypothetical protein JCM19992_01120 [Thermostilla marina]